MLAFGFNFPVTNDSESNVGKLPKTIHSSISSTFVAVGNGGAVTAAAAAAAVGMTKSSKKKKNKNENRVNQKNSGVAEASLIRISKLLQQFRESPSDVYTFDANLDNKERAFIHETSRKMGFSSKSAGRGAQRQISVFKSKKKGAARKEKERVISVKFSEESNMVLQELFTRFPPGMSGAVDEAVDACSKRADKFNGKRDDIFSRVPLGKADILKKAGMLASRIAKTPSLKQIAEVRSNLPIASFENSIITTINSNQVVLVCGETGCGKTTQVPQYILDHMWRKGESCKIVCTQPRRISAISVAERISNERGESVGGTVGYKIRLEWKGDKNSSIVFCTNGVFLKVLVSLVNPASNVSHTASKSTVNKITDITHIVVDEIHERDWSSDFMIAILRDILPSHPQLRLILMSATVDTERFSQYFGGCPIIHVPGFTHPVRTFYLEDALALVNPGKTNHHGNTQQSSADNTDGILEQYRRALDEAITLACENDDLDPILEIVSSQRTPCILNYRHSSTGVTPLMVVAGKGSPDDICMLLSFGADFRIRDCDGQTAFDWAEENQAEAVEILKKHSQNCGKGRSLVDKYLESINPDLVDDDLIEKLLRKICCDSKEGAVLVFLPGWDDINRTRERLNSSPFFRDQSKFVIIPLHSMVPSTEQKKVFRRVASGCRKIVLSTNIAETAVTIDDVVCVIDSGRVKEKSYDPYGKVSTLQSSWVSKASAKQREGRAGRCQPGVCYHLFSKMRAESLPDFQVPEIRRMPIEELCLQIKLLDQDCRIETFLQKTLDPPVLEAITNAIALLQDIGALSIGEKLTEFGLKLGLLPVHPSTGKMLLFAISMNCLDPALTLACASDYRDPFTLPMFPEDKKKAAAAKAELSSLYRAHSDQLAVVAGFECWKNAKEFGQEARFCSQYFVSGSAMSMLSGMRRQLLNELARQGFLREEDSSGLSSNMRDSGVLHAVLMAGMYPMVGILHGQLKFKGRFFIDTARGEKASLNQHSVCSKMSLGPHEARPLVAYDEVMRSSGGMTVKNCTLVGPLPFMLFAKDIAVAPSTEEKSGEAGGGWEGKVQGKPIGDVMSYPENMVTVIVDGWAHFTSTALTVAHIYCLRERLSAAIMFKVKSPRGPLPPALSESVSAIVMILSRDAFAGISETLMPAEPAPSTFSSTMFGKGYDSNSRAVPRMVPRPQPAWHVPIGRGYYGEGIDLTQQTRGRGGGFG